MKWIMFFDGNCGLCSRSIRFLSAADTRNQLRFAPLQGETAARHQLQHHASLTNGSMVVVREHDDFIALRSDAVLELFCALGGFWKLLLVGRVIPQALRDWIYEYIARHRIAWFGHADQCQLPDPKLVAKLLP